MEGPLEIKSTDTEVKEPVKSEAPLPNSDNSERSDADSPPPHCSICLGKLINISFTDSCLHMFCFTCLLQWSKIKTECPLCKKTFKSIIYNMRSEKDYDRYHVPHKSVPPIPRTQVTLDLGFDWDVTPRRFVYRTTMTGNRRNGVLLNPEQVARREQLPNIAPVTSHEERRRRRADPTNYRRTVYRHGIWAAPLSGISGRFRECSPEYYRRHPEELDRLIPWLNRELQVLLTNEPTHLAHVLNVIMTALTQYDIRSQEFRNVVQPYLGVYTSHFAHELLNFAQTIFDLVGYDQYVTYLPRGLSNAYATLIESPIPSSISSSSNSSSSSSSSSHSSLVSDNSDVRIVSEAIDLRVNTEVPSTLSPISMPGPSAVGQTFRRVETSNNVVPELLTVSSSSSGTDSDCEIVGYVKPRHERTPEIIELFSSDSEHVSVFQTSNGNVQSTVRIPSETEELPSTSHVIRSSSSSCSTSSDAASYNDLSRKQKRRMKIAKRIISQKYKRLYERRSRLSRKRKLSSSDESYSSSSECSVKKCKEKQLRKTRYRVQTKGTGRLKLIKREESYSEDSYSDSSSTGTDKERNKKCCREYKSKRDGASSANNHVTKSAKTTRSKEKTSNSEKLKAKTKDSKYSENRQSRSRSDSVSSDASERDKRPNCRYKESRDESRSSNSASSTDMSENEYKSKSKKKTYYSSDSEDDRLRSSSQCSHYSNKSYSHRRKSKRKEKYKDKERHRSSRIFNLSQSNASTILTKSMLSKNDVYPKHSDRKSSDCKEKHKSRKESKHRKSESERKLRSKKKRRRIQSSSTSG